MVTRPSRVSRALLLLALPALAMTRGAIAQNAPPAQAQSAPPLATAPGSDLRIYPKNGQTQEQLWADRYECHNWSKTQSGYDPTQRDGGVTSTEAAERRDAYHRSMTACLEARGYGVAYAAPARAAPAAPPPRSAPPVQRYSPAAPELRYHPLVVQIAGGGTLTEGDNKPTLDDGGNVSVGLTWFPTSALPLGIRLDGSYNRFTQTLYSRALAAAATGTNVVFGHQDLYGGDVDAQLDLAHNSSRMKMYLFGGGGWYRERTVFKQLTQQPGTFCYFYCFPALFDVISTAERTTTPWRKSWNAGFGMEFALADPVSFFIEARYLRIAPYSANDAYIPIQIGLRF